jgi:hypothetical protein
MATPGVLTALVGGLLHKAPEPALRALLQLTHQSAVVKERACAVGAADAALRLVRDGAPALCVALACDLLCGLDALRMSRHGALRRYRILTLCGSGAVRTQLSAQSVLVVRCAAKHPQEAAVQRLMALVRSGASSSTRRGILAAYGR